MAKPRGTRRVPGWLTTDPGLFTVLSSNQSMVKDFQLTPSIVTTSERYGVTDPDGNGQWYAVNSMPRPFQGIRSPTKAQWDLLRSQFPDHYEPSANTLANGSLVIRSAEALGPSRSPPAVALNDAHVGQSLFLEYKPNPGNVANPGNPVRIHWLQFVTTNFPSDAENHRPGVPFIDCGPDSPWYDEASLAHDTGFLDLPARKVQAAPITWRADLFIVSQNTRGAWVVWQGIRWGWQAGPSPYVVTANGLAG